MFDRHAFAHNLQKHLRTKDWTATRLVKEILNQRDSYGSLIWDTTPNAIQVKLSHYKRLRAAKAMPSHVVAIEQSLGVIPGTLCGHKWETPNCPMQHLLPALSRAKTHFALASKLGGGVFQCRAPSGQVLEELEMVRYLTGRRGRNGYTVAEMRNSTGALINVKFEDLLDMGWTLADVTLRF